MCAGHSGSCALGYARSTNDQWDAGVFDVRQSLPGSDSMVAKMVAIVACIDDWKMSVMVRSAMNARCHTVSVVEHAFLLQQVDRVFDDIIESFDGFEALLMVQICS